MNGIKKMSAQQAIDELVRSLRFRAQRYKRLAGALYDRRTAAQVAAFAADLEAEARRLENQRWPAAGKRHPIPCR
jgi:hypothetical protein